VKIALHRQLSRWPKHWRFLLYGAASTLAVIPVLLLLFAWSGIYNVAASAGHWRITTAILDLAKSSSIRTHSLGIRSPSLEDKHLIRLGAGHFAVTCAGCHGAPGDPVKPVPNSMLPAPPDLSRAASEWKPREIYWIVRHGLKYTGMPAWAAQQRGDEVWPIIAFLLVLPELSAEEYRSLVKRKPAPSSTDIIGTVPKLGTCLTCHDGPGLPATSNLVPKLAGQTAPYFVRSLRAYADGTRFSGIMEPIAAGLTAGEVELLAEYYTGLARADVERGSQDQALLREGRDIFHLGIAVEGVPPCASCHGRAQVFPLLDGQSAQYITTQLRIFQSGDRGTNAQIDLMRAIALRLDSRAIDAVATYLASLPAGGLGSATNTTLLPATD
jgi:cytochrome c553